MTRPPSPSPSTIRQISIVLAAVLLVGLAGLGSRDLWPPDEPKYALVAQEMLDSGQWAVPHVNGEPYPDKPPLLFWLIALFSLPVGKVCQATAVLPSLLSGLLALVATARLGIRLDPLARAEVGWAAAGLLAVSYRFIQQVIVGQIDMLLCAATTWAFVLLLEGAGLTPLEPSRRRVVLAFGLMGLGTLAKGPVALIVPLGGALVFGALTSPWHRWSRALLSWGWLAYAIVVGAWLAPAIQWALSSGHQAWVNELLLDQTLVRYARSWHHHQPFWYLFVVPLYDMLPTMILAPAAFWSLRAGKGDETTQTSRRAIAAACLFVVIFFSIPSGKRSIYLLPMYPWLTCWLALELAGRRAWRLYRPEAAFLGLVLGVAGAWLSLPLLGLDLSKREIPSTLSWLGLALVFVSISLIPRALGGFRSGAWKLQAIAWTAFYLVGVGVVMPQLNERRSARLFVEEIFAVTRPDSGFGMIDYRAQFGFYSGHMLTADPADEPAMISLVDALHAPAAQWVIVRERDREILLEKLDPTSSVKPVAERQVGNHRYIAYANPAARIEP